MFVCSFLPPSLRICKEMWNSAGQRWEKSLDESLAMSGLRKLNGVSRRGVLSHFSSSFIFFRITQYEAENRERKRRKEMHNWYQINFRDKKLLPIRTTTTAKAFQQMHVQYKVIYRLVVPKIVPLVFLLFVAPLISGVDLNSTFCVGVGLWKKIGVKITVQVSLFYLKQKIL